MKQAFEQELITLRRAIRQWLDRIGWRRDTSSIASRSLARDLGLPPEVVSDVLDRTAAALRKLSLTDDSIEARFIIDRAVNELAKFGYHSRPLNEAAIEHYLRELPSRDYSILRHFKQGRKHIEIARLMGTDVESVRRSLVKTYADLRMRMTSPNGGDGGALPANNQRHTSRLSGH